MSSTIQNASPWSLPIRFRRPMAIALFLITLSSIPLIAKADPLDDSLVLFVRSIDANRDGFISRGELSVRISQATENDAGAQSVQALQMMTRGFSLMDTNRDGQLSAAEIGVGINTRFANADRDNNSALTRNEASGGMPMVARNFATIDARGTGSVSLSQVRNFIAQSMKSATVSARNRQERPWNAAN